MTISNKEDLIQIARKMRRAGASWAAVAAQLNIGKTTVQRMLEGTPEGCVTGALGIKRHGPMNPIRLPSEDTRDLTGRLMGDPLPGRSALDRQNR